MEYFEDIEEGQVREFGSYEVDEDEILTFAEQYDPQPFHTDPEAAAQSMFGGLIASGWHTAAMTMRMIVEHLFSETAATGSKGIDELRWPNPVRPGDTLHVEHEVLEKEPRDDGLGLVRGRTTTRNQDGDVVLSMVGNVLYERREA